MTDRIYIGHTPDVLKTLPDKSVLGRQFILIDLNEKYIDMQLRRVGDMFCQPEIIRSLK